MRNCILLYISLIFLNSCSDNVDMRKSDLKKYPWLSSFLVVSFNDFEGIQNIDMGTIQFSFSSPEKIRGSVFVKIDSLARRENWLIINSSYLHREYSKSLNIYELDSVQTVIKIELDTIENKMHYNIK